DRPPGDWVHGYGSRPRAFKRDKCALRRHAVIPEHGGERTGETCRSSSCRTELYAINVTECDEPRRRCISTAAHVTSLAPDQSPKCCSERRSGPAAPT